MMITPGLRRLAGVLGLFLLGQDLAAHGAAAAGNDPVARAGMTVVTNQGRRVVNLQIDSPAGSNITVQTASDLRSPAWKDTATMVISGGKGAIMDPAPPSSGTSFYRLRVGDLSAPGGAILAASAVGYERFDWATGRLALARADFIPQDGSGRFTVTNLLGSQVPVGTVVYLFDRKDQVYRTESRASRSGAWMPGTNAIPRGEGFWLRMPSTGSNATVYLMGEVPSAATAPSTTVYDVRYLSLLGMPYPVAFAWTNSSLAGVLPYGSVLFRWNYSNQVYYPPYSKGLRSGWGSASNVVVQPGEGFWVQCTGTGSVQWTTMKPYTWP